MAKLKSRTKKSKLVPRAKAPVSPENMISAAAAFCVQTREALEEMGKEPKTVSEKTALSVQRLLDSHYGRATLLSRCILHGLVEPDVEVSADVQFNIVLSMIDEINGLKDESQERMALRLRRALQWAARPTITPEYGIVLGQTVLSMLTDEAVRADVLAGPEYAAYRARLAPVIDEVFPA